MAKRKGFYVPLAVDTMDDDRLLAAGQDAELLWYRLLQFVKRTCPTEGVVSTRQAERLSTKRTALPALVRVGLLRPAGEDVWTMAGWFSWNETADEIAELKAKKSRAGKKGADVRWQADGTTMADAMPVLSDRNGTRMRIDGTNDNDNDNDNEACEVDPVGVLACVVPGPSDPPSASQPQTPTPDLADVRAKLNRTLPLHAITGGKVGA